MSTGLVVVHGRGAGRGAVRRFTGFVFGPEREGAPPHVRHASIPLFELETRYKKDDAKIEGRAFVEGDDG